MRHLNGFRSVLAAIALAMLTHHARAVPVLDHPFLVASDYLGGELVRLDPLTGNRIDVLAFGLFTPGELALGPDGSLYVSQTENHQVLRLNPQTGEVLSTIPIDSRPRGLAFGRDGKLYIAEINDSGTPRVLRYDPATGAASTTLISGDLIAGPTGLTIGPSGDLFVATDTRGRTPPDTVRRFDPETGALRGVVTATGISTPQYLLFGPDGSLFVSNQGTGNITHFAPDGTSLGQFAGGIGNAQGLVFLPNGDLLAGTGGPFFKEYNGTTGAFVRNLGGDFSFAHGIVYVPEPTAALGAASFLTLLRRRGRSGATRSATH